MMTFSVSSSSILLRANIRQRNCMRAYNGRGCADNAHGSKRTGWKKRQKKAYIQLIFIDFLKKNEKGYVV